MHKKTISTLVSAALLVSATAAAGQTDLEARYEAGALGEVMASLSDSSFAQLSLDAQLLHLLSEARAARGYHALEQLSPLLALHPQNPAVLATAAVIHHATGRLDEAGEYARAALEADPSQVEAWRALSILRLHQHDPEGALAAYRESRRVAPERVGGYWDVLFGQSIAEGLGEGAIRADALEARARVHDGAGRKEDAARARNRASLYRLVAGLPFFMSTSGADLVVLPFEPCFEGTPYRCIDLQAGAAYKVLVDSGNEYGFGVHSPALRDAIATFSGGATSVTTGSVDTAMVASDLFADSVVLGGLVLRNVPAVASPKVREPYWDANLNPFFVRDRVVTLDYVEGRFIARTKARFDRDMAASGNPTVRVPMYDPDRPYVLAEVNGHPATAVIETGSEILSLSVEFATQAGLPLRAGTRRWRDRVLDVQRTDVHVSIGGFPFFSDTVEAWPGRVWDRCTGMLYDVVIGPGSMEGRFSLSYDPFDRVVVLEAGPAHMEPASG